MDPPIFERDGARFVATELARGPWDPGSCHAGAPAGLLAALLDDTPSLVPMRGVRLTFDLLRPVPLTPVEVTTAVVREGKRVQLVEATMATPEGVELIRCRALRVRIGELDLPAGADTDTPAPRPGPERAATEVERTGQNWGVGFWTAMEIRALQGSVLGDPGPGTAWFRLVAPLADGVATTPLARAGAAADYGNGLAPPVPVERVRYLNPDLTVDLHRLPEGEWIALDSRSVAHRSGVGLTTSQLFDHRGRIGLAAQSLYLDAVDQG